MSKPLVADKSAEAPLSELAKQPTADASSASVFPPVKGSDYDINVHPSVVEGAPGSAEDSKYAHGGDVKEADKSESDMKPPPSAQQRKKSITEKLSETWHDLKAKAGQQHRHTRSARRCIARLCTAAPLLMWGAVLLSYCADAVLHRKQSKGDATKDAAPAPASAPASAPATAAAPAAEAAPEKETS